MSKYRIDVYADNELESLIYSGPATDEPISSAMCKLLEPEVLATLVKNIKFYPSDEILVNSLKGAKVYENDVLYATVSGWQPHWHAEAKIGPKSSFGFFVDREHLA
jgi:hypothetical protein